MWKFRWEHHTLTCPKIVDYGPSGDCRNDVVAAMLRPEDGNKENIMDNQHCGCTAEDVLNEMLESCHTSKPMLLPGLETAQLILHDLVADGFARMHNLDATHQFVTFTFVHLNDDDHRATDWDLHELRQCWSHLKRCVQSSP